MTSARRTIAVYGGSFNPPHRAHVMVANAVSENPLFDALWIVPTYQHPFDKALIDFSHRLRMCELAFAGIARTRVLDIERKLGGRSLMVRTLQALAAQHPDVQLRLVIGSDLVEQLDRWTEPDTIRALAPLWIVQREGSEQPDVTGQVFPAVSSTEIRTRVSRGEPFEHLVPTLVAQYIDAHNLYRDAPGG